MREITVNLVCELHADTHTPAVEEHTASLDGGKPRIFAVCEECVPIVKAFADLVSRGQIVDKPKMGRPPGSKTKRPVPPGQSSGEVWCPVCGQLCASRTGLGSHGSTQHKMKLKVLEAYATERGGSLTTAPTEEMLAS